MTNETKTSGVPKLNLAPRLTRPLSLWNPLDYLRLLYWVFYFPQAIRWYVEVFGQEEEDFSEVKGWQKKWKWFVESSIKRNFFIQGLFLQTIIPMVISYALQKAGLRIDWNILSLGISTGVMINIIVRMLFSDIGAAFMIGILGSISGLIVCFFAWNIPFGIAISIMFGIFFGISSSILPIADTGIQNRMIFHSVLMSVVFSFIIGAFGATIGVNLKIFSNFIEGIEVGIVFGISCGLSSGLAILRPDVWILGLRSSLRKFQQQQWDFPRSTLLPQYDLILTLNQWLQEDWEKGLEVIYQLQRYTFQFIAVIQSINFVLARTSPDTLLLKVAQLADSSYDSQLIKYVSASVSYQIKQEIICGILLFSEPTSIGMREGFSLPRIDTPARAAAAGFWYLWTESPYEAEKAFTVVKEFKNGNEMLLLSQILNQCSDCSTLEDIALVVFPDIPVEPHLRPDTWYFIEDLQDASEDIRVVEQAISNAARAYASNRALGSLTNILDSFQSLPRPERYLIARIAENWRSLLLKVTGEIGNLAITKPVQSPYTIGDPVIGDRFIGRDDIMRQLEEFWFMNDLPQSIVLYGHRRMGKTSILRNIATRLGADTRIAYINLNLCEICNTLGEVLINLTDELAKVTQVPKPTDADLLNLPEITFRRYVSAIANTNQKLIIILDEFETLETLIAAGKISPDFLSYLRGLIQLSPTIAFAFAGLHTLEEMTADYFKPFFASILPIRVGFLDRAATRQLLANPDPDYPLDFTPELLDEAHRLTNGQPYLIQLIGFQLTRHYNAQVFEQGRPRDPQLTQGDLTTILDSPDFYDRGRYYFTGVWNQAAETLPHQQSILTHLAHHPDRTITQISQTLNLDPILTQQSLDLLKRHDVADTSPKTEPHEPDRWSISIELFRRWLIRQAG